MRDARINTYKPGGTFKVYPITEKGRAFLEQIKVKYNPPQGIGDPQHQYCANKIIEWCRSRGYPAKGEDFTNGKHVDVGATIDGKRVAFD